MLLNFHGSFDPQNLLTVDGQAWCVPSVESTTRYCESQVSLAVML